MTAKKMSSINCFVFFVVFHFATAVSAESVKNIETSAFLPNNNLILEMPIVELGPSGVRVLAKYLNRIPLMNVEKGIWIESYSLIKYKVLKAEIGYFKYDTLSFLLVIKRPAKDSGIKINNLNSPFSRGFMLFTLDGHKPVKNKIHYKIQSYRAVTNSKLK